MAEKISIEAILDDSNERLAKIDIDIEEIRKELEKHSYNLLNPPDHIKENHTEALRKGMAYTFDSMNDEIKEEFKRLHPDSYKIMEECSKEQQK